MPLSSVLELCENVGLAWGDDGAGAVSGWLPVAGGGTGAGGDISLWGGERGPMGEKVSPRLASSCVLSILMESRKSMMGLRVLPILLRVGEVEIRAGACRSNWNRGATKLSLSNERLCLSLECVRVKSMCMMTGLMVWVSLSSRDPAVVCVWTSDTPLDTRSSFWCHSI